jgi:hypothetical protein
MTTRAAINETMPPFGCRAEAIALPTGGNVSATIPPIKARAGGNVGLADDEMLVLTLIAAGALEE